MEYQNIWNWFLQGMYSLIDMVMGPVMLSLDPFMTKIGIALPLDVMTIAAKSYLPVVFPILGVLNFAPLITVVTLALAVEGIKKGLRLWTQILDLIPALR